MGARLAHLWRHPIKAHGAEAVQRTTLEPGRTMPLDRLWAIGHEAARIDPEAGAWAPCANFSRGAKSPELMAIRAATDEATGRLRLTHPRRPSIELDPDDPVDRERLIAWVRPLSNPDRARPAFVTRANGRGMTDSDFASISVLTLASLDALGERVGRALSMERFRGNLWIDGVAPWEEFGWIGRTLAVGQVRLTVRERITRCAATAANPETGRVDADTLGALEAGWGHRDFGIYAEVAQGGTIALGDPVSLL